MRRTVNLLPEIFQTETNRQFLGATLDQLTQEIELKRTQGFVGRRIGPGVTSGDNYVVERDAERTAYQLEPSVVFMRDGTSTAEDLVTYPGMLDALRLNGVDTDRQDRLWQNQYYAWDPFCDLDKFSNYSQYYWLPQGPDSVDVFGTVVPLIDDFTVSRRTVGYEFSGVPGRNPILTLARGGNYKFEINQPGHKFWIQSQPGVDGRLPSTPNISSRDVLGVIDNGVDAGSVEFSVPKSNAQDFYYNLEKISDVDLLADDNLRFIDINNVYLSDFLQRYPSGIDGITSLDGRTIIFTNPSTSPARNGFRVLWRFDPLLDTDTDGTAGSYDSVPFDGLTDIQGQAQRYSVWRINYQLDTDGNVYLSLESVRDIPTLTTWNILYGDVYSSTQWYKNSSGYFERVPLLTAINNVLYYQDSSDPNLFGEIRLIDLDSTDAIRIDDILGSQTYTSPNGVSFTNGLKVKFVGEVEPASFANREFYVEGVGTGPGLVHRVGFVDGVPYFGPFRTLANGVKVVGGTPTDDFRPFIYDTVQESIDNAGTGLGLSTSSQPNNGVFPEFGIQLIPVQDLVTPEQYTRTELVPFDSTPFDTQGYDSNIDAPLVPDYITVNRAGLDRNAWSRSNRWFHKDVINYAASRNGVPAEIDNDARARRPIIEFRQNLALFNSGRQAQIPVNVVDLTQTDAMSNVNGKLGYGVDGYDFLDGSLVVFASDIDPQVRNKIWRVDFIDPRNVGTNIINLTPVTTVSDYQQTVSLNGVFRQGFSYWFDGSGWRLAQQKTNVNQPPLFDVFDLQGRSYGDNDFYPSSTFAGSKLFGYSVADTASVDEVLGFSLRFLNINNIGDILFENYFYTDQFLFVQDRVSREINTSSGFVRQYATKNTFYNQIGWQSAAEQSRSRQIFRFIFQGADLALGIPVDDTSAFPAVQVFVNNVFLDPVNYTVTVTDIDTKISLSDSTTLGAEITVAALANQPSPNAFFEIPDNLENNTFNENSARFTLGGIRSHYDSIGQNLKELQGSVNGANNSRDLGNLVPFGTKIIQNSGPMVLAGTFLRKLQFEFFNSLVFNAREYEKYKARIMDLAASGNFINLTATEILDEITQEIAVGRDQNFPFYWSDMLPTGSDFSVVHYTVTPISTNIFDTFRIYDFTQSNFQGIMVYLNGTILIKDRDYEIPVDTAAVVINVTLTPGDVITIREYETTYGSFVPNTPTKMGMYPAWIPAILTEQTLDGDITFIRGHDGSLTVSYGDIRDQILLEYETRIYNNLKTTGSVPLRREDVMPGAFRGTDYSAIEATSILAKDFLNWVGENGLNFTRQEFDQSRPFSYNYSQATSRVDGRLLLGNWRGIYLDFYDTLTPNTTPWELLGFTIQPSWWEDEYGPAPYTSGNLVLWEDLERGVIREPGNERVDPRFARPGLVKVIPADEEGRLLDPLEAVVGNYSSQSFRRSWTFGDVGPVEAAWRTSSSYPFAIMRLLAITKPAKFFGLFADLDRYKYDLTLAQFVWQNRYRLEAKQLAPLYGNGQSRASYINWIIDYNQQLGVDSASSIERVLDNLDVRLAWRMAGFSDKRYLKIFTERSTPRGLNTSLLLPDESYQLLLYPNVTQQQVTYSSVIVQRVDDGWSVSGYNNDSNFFEILVSIPGVVTETIESGGASVKVNTTYTSNIARVPYGFVFRSRAAVCDFLLSYGQLLTRRGLKFESRENTLTMDWRQMVNEFLYWSNQGWSIGSIINLNPGASVIEVEIPGLVVESLVPSRIENLVLDQNQRVLPPSNTVIDRDKNLFRIRSIAPGRTINFLNLKFNSTEHVMLLDNRSIFADLIYDPTTGSRQSRVLVSGWISANWDGTVNAPGFVLNQDNVQEWQPNRKYTKGDIVLFKNEYWSAADLIDPSAEFDYSLWIRSDYDEIQKGLLLNAAGSSDQLATAYSTYNANLEQEIDLFSYGTIGFRPRNYMQALNLDDVSQVNLYQQFLGSKGTIRSAEIFSLADLGKEVAQYDIYENWAVLRSTYGATANRSYVEMLLDSTLQTSDPSSITVISPGDTARSDQTVDFTKLWKTSYRLTGPDFLPTVSGLNPEISLPSAGYVNLDDVDYTIFDLEDDDTIVQNIDSIGVGTTIWVARVNTYDWNVYRCDKIPGNLVRVQDNLDGRSLVTFNQTHRLSVGDVIIIKYFNEDVDGVYRVLSTPTINSITIDFTFEGLQTTLSGNGIGLTLISTRVAQPADIENLAFAQQLSPGVKIWVDNDGNGNWEVLEKTDPFQEIDDLEAPIPYERSLLGSSISQGLFNLTCLSGSPNFNPTDLAEPPGAVYIFAKDPQDVYQFQFILQPNAANVVGFGHSVDVGGQNWSVMGAPLSDDAMGYATTMFVQDGLEQYAIRQLLVTPDQQFGSNQFGYSVTMSQNERWMYVSAPVINQVYAYTKVDVQTQIVEYLTQDGELSYDYSDQIKINSSFPLQLSVTLDAVPLTFGTDYTVSSTSVNLTANPEGGKLLIISRRQAVQLDQRVIADLETDNIVGTGSGSVFTVNNVRGEYLATLTSPGSGYAVSDLLSIDQDLINTDDIIPPSPISVVYITSVGTTITVSSVSGIVAGMTIRGTGFVSGQYVVSVDPFSSSIVVSSSPDSTPIGLLTFSHDLLILVTAVDDAGGITGYTQSGTGVTNGSVFPLDKYLSTVTDIYSFTVKVDEQLQRPHIDYDFNSDSALQSFDLVFNTVPASGSQIRVTADSYFTFVSALPVPTLPRSSNAGFSISCTSDGSEVIIGAPDINDGDGQAFVINRSVQRFIVAEADTTDFVTVRDLEVPGKISVKVNNVYQVPNDLNVGGTWQINDSVPGNVFVEFNQALNVGDVVEIETNQFDLIQTLSSRDSEEDQKFGYRVDQCVNDCSLYLSSPFNSEIAPEAGKVEYFENEGRVYGSVTTQIANPVLTENDHIRINNQFVKLTGTTIQQLQQDIEAARIPNVTVTATPDITFTGDGTTRTFNIGSIYGTSPLSLPRVLINDVLQTLGVNYSYNATAATITFSRAPVARTTITVVSGRLIFSVTNRDAAGQFDLLRVQPGTGSLFQDLGIDTYYWQQKITSPNSQPYARFGEGLHISNDTLTLLVGAPFGDMVNPNSFDGGTTQFDSLSTTFSGGLTQSGVVYMYDKLSSIDPTLEDPNRFVFGQQITSPGAQSQDRFGSSIDYTTGVLLIGAPGDDLEDSALANFGKVAQYENLNRVPAWAPVRQQNASVDVNLMNTAYLYDVIAETDRLYLDFFNPLQGKLLGVVRQNIDYIGGIDPAAYNTGQLNNFGLSWGPERVGHIWWDVSSVRFIDANQNDADYAINRWGSVFPGSTIDMYQWVASDVPPADYAGPGTPRTTANFTQKSYLTQEGILETNYFFWVSGLDDVANSVGKTLSVTSLAQYIENPRSSGIPYVAPIAANAFALYNSLDYLQNHESVLHVEYDRELNDNEIHVEYELIPQNRADGWVSDSVYRKILDSLSGTDTTGAQVPDINLSASELYGIAFRPRQSMVVNRFLALQNYLSAANRLMARFPITEIRTLNILNSFDPEPSATSGVWDARVADIDELFYQDFFQVPLGYRYLVSVDSTNNGLWSVYQVVVTAVTGARGVQLLRVQSYDTRQYWREVDWYQEGYNPLIRIYQEVPNRSSLDTLENVPQGSSVKVTANSNNRWEIYRLQSEGWRRVGLEKGTIAINQEIYDYALGRFGFDSEVFDAQYFDQAPFIETRKIIEALNQEIFVGDLLIYRNELLVLLFNFILTEQINPQWLIKTSLIDVDHTIRELVPFNTYRTDNQDFVLDYINEVKPYHVQIREFNLKYQGQDVYQGDLSDFDLPAYFDPQQGIFISPILDDTNTLSTTSSVNENNPIWQEWPYSQWYNNYLLSIGSVSVLDGGSGYLSPPVVVVSSQSRRPATMVARINSAGIVIAVDVVDPGEGYLTTAQITFVSDVGVGAKAVCIMSNTVVRNIKTVIKYDRYSYSTAIQTWTANVVYATGDRVRFADRVWQATQEIVSSDFDPTVWTVVPADVLNGIDRTMGYYVPTINQTGLDLALLVSGIDYPGVQVTAPRFDQNTGYDVGSFDVNPFDNISFGPEGQATYDPAILDSIIESSFLDTYLGTRFTDINVEGGAFVDTWESHAPEELVPGITYDTLDIRIFTTPGADWANQGHGFPIVSRSELYQTGFPSTLRGIDPEDILVQIIVINSTTGQWLSIGNDYEVDWSTLALEFDGNVQNGDVLTFTVCRLGGGNQLYSTSVYGDELIGNSIIIPIATNLIENFVVFINTVQNQSFTFARAAADSTRLTFSSPIAADDFLVIYALGPDTTSTSSAVNWSAPVYQSVLSDGSPSLTLTNSLQGSNPADIIVNVNGRRARPAESIEYFVDGSTTVFELPSRGGYNTELISDTEVSVYVNNQPLILGVDFELDPYTGGPRTVQLVRTPPDGARLVISVNTAAQYKIFGNQLIFQTQQGLRPVAGDIIEIVTWNDTESQRYYTQVFAGPNESGVFNTEGYDTTDFDLADVNNESGSFAFQTGVQILNNRFDTGRQLVADRVFVTLDGRYLTVNRDYVVEGSLVIISGAPINPAQIVAITTLTERAVPSAMAFRIFQDMRGTATTYRIANTTRLSDSISAVDTTIVVENIAALPVPNPDKGQLGSVTIEGERIFFRGVDLETSAITGCRRGVSGTAAAPHAGGTTVISMDPQDALVEEYQDQFVRQSFLGDGSTRLFVASDLTISLDDSTEDIRAVRVSVAGTEYITGYDVLSTTPVTIQFDTAPANNVQITVSVLRGQSWYQPGPNTPSNGVPLQSTDTFAARFLRGGN